jgi:hypothetical protein
MSRQVSVKRVSSPKYATGRHALGECRVCGDQVALSQMQKRWDGVMTCSQCNEKRHSQLSPVKAKDAVALRNPAPKRDKIPAVILVKPSGMAFGFEMYDAAVVVT